MKHIIPPLKNGDSGPDVRNLQEALLLLIVRSLLQFPVDILHQLISELQALKFASNTQKAVTLFQEQQHLNSTGEVDGPTADALNRILKEMGELDGESNGEKRMVVGQVVQEDSAPFTGEVILFGETDHGSITLGDVKTDSEGRYSINYDVAALDGGKLRVVAFDADAKNRASAMIETPGTMEIVNLTVPLIPTHRVNGQVTSLTRVGVTGLHVQVVDKNIGPDILLAEASIGADGSYAIEFPYTGSKQRPDLQARVRSAENLLGVSEIRYNASTTETLNVALTDESSASLPSEYETLIAQLKSHFSGNLGDLEESEEQSNITFLANKTNWDARAIALAALADQFSALTSSNEVEAPSIPAPFFYALFRAGVPTNEDALYQVDAKAAAGIWTQALGKGVIPAAMADQIPQALNRFETLATERALAVPVIGGVSSLKEMLLASEVNDEQQQKEFADIYTRHRNDPGKFWEEVTNLFPETVQRLRFDGQLAKLTLNNAPLMHKVHGSVGQNNLNELGQIVEHGFFRAQKWQDIIGSDTLPARIPGATVEEQRKNYAELLAAQVRLRFPTQVVAQLIADDDMRLAPEVKEPVRTFLTEHQGKFQIGGEPVELFIKKNNVEISPTVTKEIKSIQRAYQITTSDRAMSALLNKGLNSAHAVVRHGENEFVETFKNDVGGETEAKLIYAKAQQVHLATLNIATSYLIGRTAPAIGAAKFVNPAPQGADSEITLNRDVIAYPTLEELFDEMDYCECEHCRSILSPAAYLVNLLQFIDFEEGAWTTFLTKWKTEHGGVPYPFPDVAAWNNAGVPHDTEITPLQVLLSRRPDVAHLPLTCENTNTPLPYIDVVNETLEYYVTNNLTLNNYEGHSTGDDVKAEELLASPQFVTDEAYNTLAGAWSPAPLPFHRSLENLRRYFDRFNTPLSEVMEKLRKDESVDRASHGDYGWRDILMEELGLSRAEHKILTNYDPPDNIRLSLQQLYGYDSNTTDELINAKSFVRLAGITYEELIEILKTRFINPNSVMMLPKLERLGVSFARLKELKESNLTGEAWLALLPQPLPDASKYGGSIEGWVKNDENFGRLTSLITLFNPVAEGDLADFDQLELRYTHPDTDSSKLHPVEFSRLIRFIRLWKKLGWTIEQTDKVLVATYPGGDIPAILEDRVNLERLDHDFLMLLPRLAVLKRVMKALNLTPDRDLSSLLVCYAWFYTWGETSLYKQMFLNPTLLKLDPVFADDGYGNFLLHTDPATAAPKLMEHTETLRGAFQLTETEWSQIMAWTGFNAGTPLDMNNISTIFRLGWLARKLKLSVREFLLLEQFTGIHPFGPLDPPEFSLLRFINLVQAIRASGLTPAQVLYLVWNQDISGNSAPDENSLLELARSLRTSLTTIENEFSNVTDPDGQSDIKQTRKRQQALQVICTTAKTDLEFTTAVLDDAVVLHSHTGSNRPALDDVVALGEPETISRIWSGHLEAPENGQFHFHIEADEGANVTMTFAGAGVGLSLTDNKVWSNTTPLELRAGTLYGMTLKVEQSEALVVRWDRNGRDREVIPPRYLYAATSTDGLQVVYTRFLKVASLARALRLTAAEIAHFATHEDYRIQQQGWFNTLQVTGSPDAATATALSKALTALLDFTRIKKELSPDDERLLTVLRDPAASEQNGSLFTLTRWTAASFTTLLTRFALSTGDLSHLENFRRIHDAYGPVKSLGIPAAALINAATNEPTSTTVRDMQAALRARYDTSGWLRVLKPINDEMRKLQRDALVTYILHQMGKRHDMRHIDTADKLFEYFLMDVQMDCCMQTSRIRHALSSVQLFIDRSLMNLEPRVVPSVINAQQWEWMQRYRVWEANRKVFIWPENWLEPELRDDQSPFFKETMSELLQSDITEERATTALLNYLAKLEEVAKLEPCGMQYVENDPAAHDDITHVVACTPGAKRKYFYRRHEYGYWTPWEPITLDIEDNPVIPIVWNGRLLLFWLRVLHEPVPTRPPFVQPGTELWKIEGSSVIRGSLPQSKVKAILCWSEYYNGKWQPTKTSDVNRPADLGEGDVSWFFRSGVRLWVRGREESGALRLIVNYASRSQSFLLFNTHSLPAVGPVPTLTSPPSFREVRTDWHPYESYLRTVFWGQQVSFFNILQNLKNPSLDRVVEPEYRNENSMFTPFFYEDSQHIFYVTSAPSSSISREDSFGIVPALSQPDPAIPSLVFEPRRIRPNGDRIPTTPGLPTLRDTALEQFVSEDTHINKVIATADSVRFRDKVIGPAGVVSND